MVTVGIHCRTVGMVLSDCRKRTVGLLSDCRNTVGVYCRTVGPRLRPRHALNAPCHAPRASRATHAHAPRLRHGLRRFRSLARRVASRGHAAGRGPRRAARTGAEPCARPRSPFPVRRTPRRIHSAPLQLELCRVRWDLDAPRQHARQARHPGRRTRFAGTIPHVTLTGGTGPFAVVSAFRRGFVYAFGFRFSL
jgi:hypothetical protein